MVEKIEAGRIAARPGKAGDKTQLRRVFADAEDDWDRCGRGFGRKRGVAARRGDDGHAAADQVGHECRQAVETTQRPSHRETTGTLSLSQLCPAGRREISPNDEYETRARQRILCTNELAENSLDRSTFGPDVREGDGQECGHAIQCQDSPLDWDAPQI